MPKTRELDVALRNLIKTVGQNQDYWIGMKDVGTLDGQRARWQWEDGSDLGNYQGWSPGEPRNTGLICVQYWSRSNGYTMWDDTFCGESKRFICQAPQN
ncbi:hepatic lectin-like [Branchiostoma floridae x Branchiostoma belcheri]